MSLVSDVATNPVICNTIIKQHKVTKYSSYGIWAFLISWLYLLEAPEAYIAVPLPTDAGIVHVDAALDGCRLPRPTPTAYATDWPRGSLISAIFYRIHYSISHVVKATEKIIPTIMKNARHQNFKTNLLNDKLNRTTVHACIVITANENIFSNWKYTKSTVRHL